MVNYNAIIFSGHTERDNIICQHENVPKKAFVKLGDKIFLERIVEETLKCDKIGDIYISGMSKDEWDTNLPVTFNEDSGSMFQKSKNIYEKYILKKKDHSDIAILITSDAPLVTGEMISKIIEQCEDLSNGVIDGIFYYFIVQRENMESKFPNSRRTYAQFKDNFHVCGADISVVNIKKMLPYEKLMNDLTEKRKNVLAQLIVLNPFLVIKFLLKRLTLDKFMRSINKRIFKVKRGVHAILSENAEIAMDVDKLHQLEEVRRYYDENKAIYG